MNPAIIGMRVHQGEVIGRAIWDPILDDETYNLLIALFKDPARMPTRYPETTSRILSGICRCGVCGGPLRTCRHGGKKRKVHYSYRCAYSSHVARNAISLEHYVQESLIAWIRSGVVGRGKRRTDSRRSKHRVDDLRRQLAEATALHNSGELSTSTFARVEALMLAEIRKTERVAEEAALPAVARDLVEASDVEGHWSRLTTEERRAVLRSMVEVVVHPVTSLGRRPFERETVSIRAKASAGGQRETSQLPSPSTSP